MTEKLYDIDSHLREFTATVISCEEYNGDYSVVLDRTAFFPEAGGQESDKGYLENAQVLSVQINEKEIVHITDSPIPVGDTVTGLIDWNRRFDFMQQHSGEHIVSGVAHKLYGCENVGFHLSEEIVTLDFDKLLTREQILKLECLANAVVFRNAPFYTYYPDEDTLNGLSYRSKKELEGAVRIVEIDGADVCACCAPHVKSAGEVGLIKLLGAESLRGGVRIELKAGKRALCDYNEKYENVLKISNALCVKQNETAQAVDRLTSQINQLRFEITGLKKHIITQKANEFQPENEITALFEETFDIKELQLFSDAIYKKCGGIRAVFSPNESGFSFAICGEPERLDELFGRFKKQFNVRGGGRNGMVQGTVLADKDKLIAFFKLPDYII